MWIDTLWDAAKDASAQGATFKDFVYQAVQSFEEAKIDELKAVHDAAKKLDLKSLNNV